MPQDDPGSWTLTRLADHLKATDHRTIAELAPRAAAYVRRIREVHGAQHPELARVSAASGELAEAQDGHLRLEEDVLFPALRRTEKALRHGARAAPEDLKEIAALLTSLHADHARFLASLDELRDLTMDYALPFDACATYGLAYRTLQDLEAVLRRHLALEDDVLLPKARTMVESADGPP
jgi:regulator of cell morphogenesis and NO signaling